MAKKRTQEKKSRSERIPVEKIILGVIGVAGLITIAVVAPNALRALELFGDKKKRHWSPYYIETSLGRLKRKEWITFEERGGRKYVCLTNQGKVELLKYTLKKKTLMRKRWDGVWRMIIFDVKEKKRVIRNRVRRELKALGFARLQQSVWVFPYPCEEVAIMLKADNRIGKEVLYVEAKKIENDKALRGQFDLK